MILFAWPLVAHFPVNAPFSLLTLCLYLWNWIPESKDICVTLTDLLKTHWGKFVTFVCCFLPFEMISVCVEIHHDMLIFRREQWNCSGRTARRPPLDAWIYLWLIRSRNVQGHAAMFCVVWVVCLYSSVGRCPSPGACWEDPHGPLSPGLCDPPMPLWIKASAE